MSLFTARRTQGLQHPEAPTDQTGGKRKRRTLEELYALIDENLAILE